MLNSDVELLTYIKLKVSLMANFMYNMYFFQHSLHCVLVL